MRPSRARPIDVIVALDTEDYFCSREWGSDDAVKEAADILAEEGLTGSFFSIGEVLESLRASGALESRLVELDLRDLLPDPHASLTSRYYPLEETMHCLLPGMPLHFDLADLEPLFAGRRLAGPGWLVGR